jgi:hypothetical protein
MRATAKMRQVLVRISVAIRGVATHRAASLPIRNDVKLGCDLFRTHGMTEDMHGALVLVNESHQNTDRRVLPSAVRIDEAHHASHGKLKVDVLKSKLRVFF